MTERLFGVMWIAAVAALLLSCGGEDAGFDAADGSAGDGGDTDADSDADTDTGTGPDGGCDPSGPCCDQDGEPVGWLDEITGLCWQDPPAPDMETWEDALAECGALSVSGVDGWRLPSISELRTLIMNCAYTEPGGPCGVTDECTETECLVDCDIGCPEGMGPGWANCYMDPDLSGPCDDWFWSSTPRSEEHSFAVDFRTAEVWTRSALGTYRVRCVRGEQ